MVVRAQGKKRSMAGEERAVAAAMVARVPSRLYCVLVVRSGL